MTATLSPTQAPGSAATVDQVAGLAHEVDPAPHTRRRGEALVSAVHAATLAEIADHGLRGASMDGIAHRAGTGKASLYRRWPNVRALTLDVFLTTLEAAGAHQAPDRGSLRADYLGSLVDFHAAIQGPLGLVLRELISEAAHDPSLVAAFQERIGLRQQAQALAMFQRAMTRGEIPAQAIDPYVLDLPAAFILHRLLLTGEPAGIDECTHLFEAIVLPLVSLAR